MTTTIATKRLTVKQLERELNIKINKVGKNYQVIGKDNLFKTLKDIQDNFAFENIENDTDNDNWYCDSDSYFSETKQELKQNKTEIKEDERIKYIKVNQKLIKYEDCNDQIKEILDNHLDFIDRKKDYNCISLTFHSEEKKVINNTYANRRKTLLATYPNTPNYIGNSTHKPITEEKINIINYDKLLTVYQCFINDIGDSQDNQCIADYQEYPERIEKPENNLFSSNQKLSMIANISSELIFFENTFKVKLENNIVKLFLNNEFLSNIAHYSIHDLKIKTWIARVYNGYHDNSDKYGISISDLKKLMNEKNYNILINKISNNPMFKDVEKYINKLGQDEVKITSIYGGYILLTHTENYKPSIEYNKINQKSYEKQIKESLNEYIKYFHSEIKKLKKDYDKMLKILNSEESKKVKLDCINQAKAITQRINNYKRKIENIKSIWDNLNSIINSFLRRLNQKSIKEQLTVLLDEKQKDIGRIKIINKDGDPSKVSSNKMVKRIKFTLDKMLSKGYIKDNFIYKLITNKPQKDTLSIMILDNLDSISNIPKLLEFNHPLYLDRNNEYLQDIGYTLVKIPLTH